MPSEEEYTGILGDYHEEEPAPADVPAPEEKPKKNNALKTVGIAVASAAILGCLGFLGVKLWNNPDRTAAQPETSQGEVSANSDADANAWKRLPILPTYCHRTILQQYILKV